MRVQRWTIVLNTALACCIAACNRAASDSEVSERYRAAECIQFSARPRITPQTREWDTELTLRDGSKVIVIGAQIPGGRINVRYPPLGQELMAANAGDYVYPSDVRVDAQHDLLFVKASGLAGGIRQQTWLFEYDLRGRRLVARQQVVNDVLSAECPEGGRPSLK